MGAACVASLPGGDATSMLTFLTARPGQAVHSEGVHSAEFNSVRLAKRTTRPHSYGASNVANPEKVLRDTRRAGRVAAESRALSGRPVGSRGVGPECGLSS